MKALIALLLLTTQAAFAYDCPVAMTPERERLRAWLAPWAGTFEMANCKVEITACTPGAGDELSAVVGEIFITTANGREAYLPLTLEDSEKIEARAQIHSRTMWYIKRDKYYESELGRTETSRLEIVLGQAGIESVDLGMYATKKALRGPSKSRWYNCGLNAE